MTWDKAEYLLKKYLKPAFESSGQKWNEENDNEIKEIINAIKEGIKEEQAKQRQLISQAVKKDMTDDLVRSAQNRGINFRR
jgi:ABC-type nitrate/sulfonate/bicarbonate transport system substrate-binding protein